jgi:AmiR/NasT family two-component response regulator
MTLDLTLEAPAAPAQPFDGRSELDQLRARARCAERKAANLEHALASNRRIGMAVGILMCRHRTTAEEAFEILKTHSQHRHVKIRELAETVIYTGAL